MVAPPVQPPAQRYRLADERRAQLAAAISAHRWRLHQLTGKYKGYWSVTVDANWRLVFRFNGTNVELVDYLDFH